jgi:hypothetical protein
MRVLLPASSTSSLLFTRLVIGLLNECCGYSIANEQEHFRGGSEAAQIYSSNVDDKTLHELYVWPFAEAVNVGVGSVMCVSSPHCSPVLAFTHTLQVLVQQDQPDPVLPK